MPRFSMDGPKFEWNLGTVQLTEYDGDGFLGIQVDSLGEKGGGDPLDAAHPFGFDGRPLDPADDATGNLVLYTFEGDEGYAIALGDYRLVAKLPQLKKGGTRMYCAKGSYQVFDGDDGSATIYVPYAFNGETPTKAHVIQIGLDANGKPVIDIGSGEGPRLTILEKSITVANAAGDCYIELNDSGGVLNGNFKVTGAFDIGQASFPIAKAAEVVTALNALLTCLGTCSPPPSGLAAATAAVGAAAAALPTTMVKGF